MPGRLPTWRLGAHHRRGNAVVILPEAGYTPANVGEVVRGDGQPGYVRVNGRQICDGGCFSGSTIMARDSHLEKVARAWWRAFLRNQRTGF